MRNRVLSGVADQQILQSIDEYDRSMNRFASLMQELELHHIIDKSKEINPPKIPDNLMAEIQGKELRDDLQLQDSLAGVGNMHARPPPKARSTAVKSPDGKRSEKPRKIKSMTAYPNKGIKGGNKVLSVPIRKKKPTEGPPDGEALTKPVPARKAPMTSRRSSIDSLYIEDIDLEDTSISSDDADQAKNQDASDTQRRALQPEVSKTLAATSASTNPGGIGKTKKKLVKSPTVPKRHVVGDATISSVRKGKVPMKSKTMDGDGASKNKPPDEGLVKLRPTKLRTKKMRKKGDDDDNRSVVSISSKKKAKLKAIQARKGKQDVKVGIRKKKDMLMKKRINREIDPAKTATEPQNSNAEDKTGISSSNVRTEPRARKPMHHDPIQRDAQKSNIGAPLKKKVLSPKKLRPRDNEGEAKSLDVSEGGSRAPIFPNESVDQVNPNSSKMKKKSENQESKSKVAPPPKKEQRAGKKVTTKSRSNLSPPRKVKKPPTGPAVSSTKSLRQKQKPASERGGPTKLPVRKPQAQNARSSFQWPPTKPQNVDDSANRLTDKWVPAPPSAAPGLQRVQPNSTAQDSRNVAKSLTVEGSAQSPAKVWSNSLLGDEEENDQEEEIMLAPLSEEPTKSHSRSPVTDRPEPPQQHRRSSHSVDISPFQFGPEDSPSSVSRALKGAAAKNRKDRNGINGDQDYSFVNLQKNLREQSTSDPNESKFEKVTSASTMNQGASGIEETNRNEQGGDVAFATQHQDFLHRETSSQAKNSQGAVRTSLSQSLQNASEIDDPLNEEEEEDYSFAALYNKNFKHDKSPSKPDEPKETNVQKSESRLDYGQEEDFSFATLHKNFIHEHSSPTKNEEKAKVSSDVVLGGGEGEDFSFSTLHKNFLSHQSHSADRPESNSAVLTRMKGAHDQTPHGAQKPPPSKTKATTTFQPKNTVKLTKSWAKIEPSKQAPTPMEKRTNRPPTAEHRRNVGTASLSTSPVPKSSTSVLPKHSAQGSHTGSLTSDLALGVPGQKLVSKTVEVDRKENANRNSDKNESHEASSPFKVSGLVNDGEGDVGVGLTNDKFPKSEAADSQFKPISSWASPAEDERSGPMKRTINKKKAPVARVKKVGKPKVDRLKPQQSDDSSIVKLKKQGLKKKGEMTYAGKSIERPRRKPHPDEQEVRKGWLNPFDAGAEEQHFEFGSC